MTGYTERPETALDDLIAEQTMTPRVDPRVRCADLPVRRRPTGRVCRECGGWNGHHHVHCPEGD